MTTPPITVDSDPIEKPSMKYSFFAPALAILLCIGCGDDTQTTPEDDRNESDQAQAVPADPADVPAGMEDLNITQAQADQINAWKEQNIPEGASAADPVELTQFVRSILTPEQMPAFRDLVELGGQP